MRNHPVLKMLLLAVLLTGMACAGAIEPAIFEMLPMGDGVKLATDVYFPEGGGPYPVILARSTYTRPAGYLQKFVEQGYAAVIQDVRGMNDSEGEAHVFHAEGWKPGLTDGQDTTAWILAQPWCNGKIGTFGGSALGITQILMAPATQGLSAQVIQVAPGNLYPDLMYTGGVFRKNLLEGWLTMIQQPHMIDFYKGHPYYDTYWSYYNAVIHAEDSTAPALFIGGWYDIFAQGTLDAFTSRQYQGGPGARGKNILIMKWSCHGPDIEDDYKLNDNRKELDVGAIERAFLDCHVRGNVNALEGIAPVHYYTFGADTPDAPGNEWRTADAWPPFPVEETALYLGADGGLDTVAPGGAKTRQFTFDPADPYPTYGGGNLLMPSGAFDQRKNSAGRTDILRFATAPQSAPMEITGRVSVRLHIATDVPDTDFTAKLIDIYPEGDDREILVLDGVQRVKLRRSLSDPAPLLADSAKIVTLDIDLWSTSWIFNTGHRIGLFVSGSNFPKFELNPNTGADFPAEDGEMRVATNTVHVGGAHASALLLPVRPSK